MATQDAQVQSLIRDDGTRVLRYSFTLKSYLIPAIEIYTDDPNDPANIYNSGLDDGQYKLFVVVEFQSKTYASMISANQSPQALISFEIQDGELIVPQPPQSPASPAIQPTGEVYESPGLTWEAVADADQYEVFEHIGGGAWYRTATTSDTSITFTDLKIVPPKDETPHRHYEWKARTLGGNGLRSGFSNIEGVNAQRDLELP